MCPANRKANGAMALIEVIGVLAILVIAVSLLFPRIEKLVGHGDFSVKEEVVQARIEATVMNLQTIRTAVMQRQARFGSLPSSKDSVPGDTANGNQFDRVLLAEGLIDRPFSVKMGTRAYLRLVDVSSLSPASPVTGLNGAYDLSGSGHNEVLGASCLVEAVIEGATIPEACALNDRIDGPGMSRSTGEDLKGRVILRRGRSEKEAELHVYIAHY